MLRRVRRFFAISAVAVMAIVVLAFIALHTPPVQSRILGWSIEELERRFSLDLSADRLQFNLASRRVVMTNVRLAAVGHHDDPFFTASAVTVKLPWAAYRGRLRFDAIEVDGGHVTINRDASGVSNLPPGGTRNPDAPVRRLDVGALLVRSLDFRYHDEQHDVDIETPGIRTDLKHKIETDLTHEANRGATGPIAIDRPLLVRAGQRRVEIKPVTGQMSFDGSTVGLDAVTLDTSDGVFTLGGRVARALDQPTLDLTFTGTADIAHASQWAPPPIHVGGHAEVDATMTGAPSVFVLDARVQSADAEIGAEKNVRIDAESRLTPNGIAVGRSTIAPATGGEVHATVDAPFGAQAAWWVQADWRGIDAASAFRLAETRVLPFGAALEGTARIDRAVGEPFRLEAHNTSTPRDARGTAPLQGTVEFVIERDRWRATQAHRLGALRVDGKIGGVWNRQAASRSTFEGDLAVKTTDIGQSTRYAALFGLSSPSIITRASGPLDATVTMGGIFTEPRFVGTARSTGADVPSLGRAAFTARFDVSPQRVEVTDIDAGVTPVGAAPDAAPPAHVTGNVLADLGTRKLTGALNIDAPSAANLLSAAPEALRLDGPLTATAVIGGTVDSPDVVTNVSGNNLTLGGQPVDSLTGRARIVDEGIDIESLVLKQGPGEFRVVGRYNYVTGVYTVDATGQNIVWRGTLPQIALGGTVIDPNAPAGSQTLSPGQVEARLGIKFAGMGSIDRPTGEGAIDFTVAGGVAGQLIDQGIANIRLNGDRALVTARIPSLGAFITSNIVPASPFDFDAVVVMNRIDLAPLATLGGLREGFVTGNASLSASVKGELRTPADAQAFINLQDIQADVAGVPIRLTSPSRFAWDGKALSIDALDLSVGEGRLLAAGRLGEGGLGSARWQSTFKGELGDILRIGRPLGVPESLDGTGPLTVEWSSPGGIDRSVATAQLANGNVTWGTLPAIRDLVLDAAFNNGTLEVKNLTGHWQDGGISGTASIPRAVLEARDAGGPPLAAGQEGFGKLRIEGLSEAALAPWFDSATLAGIDGTISATLDARIVRASLDGVIGTVTFDKADFTLAGVTVSEERPAILEVQGGVVTARDVSFNAGGSPLTVTGTAHLTPADKQSLDLTVRGTADLKILSAFAPSLATDGEAKLNVGIGGPLRAPVFNGRIDVAGAEFAIREPRFLISDLNGTIALDGQRVVFDGLTGSANGGALTLDGGFLLDGGRPTAGGLTIQVQRAAFEYPQGLQSEANALVTLRPTDRGWTLEGDVRIERSEYNQTISLAALAAARRTRTPAASVQPGWTDRFSLNVFVSTDQDIRLDNNYGRLEAGAAVRVAGTVANPVLAGRVTMREGGEVYVGGNTFRVSRGDISFTNPNRIVPEFDLELRTRASGRELLLTVEGPLDRLQTDVRSTDPTVDSRDAMSMLFGGSQGEDAVALLSAELLGATGRAIGLDTLRVERGGYDTDEFRADPLLIATETDPSSRLTLSKRLRPNVELTFSQSLRESGDLSTILSYKPRRNVEIRVASRENVDRSVALRHEITFGGGGATNAAALSPQPKIASVTISGEPGQSPDELIKHLKLDTGDTFDFYHWQKDIDALRDDYHKRNYYEARIRGIRQVSDDGLTVALDYRIEPGPIAELVLEGHPLEPELVEDIREAWMRTLFDRFLLEDIQTRILRHLVTEKYIGSKVDVVVASATPERKQIRVAVTAGTQVDKRVIRASGNATMKADRLDAAIDAAGLGVDGWLDPSKIADTLKTFYRDEGYLAAEVTAGQPFAEGGLGVLPVTVDEGPRFVIGNLTFPGVNPDRRGAVTAAARLEPGAPFVNAEIDAALRRIEDHYGREGFNAVQIEPGTVPNLENRTVDVSFAILEGLQQILREVTTEGASLTRENVIRRALRLRVGAPVSLAEWSQSRKRMYDTNVFQQVDIQAVSLLPHHRRCSRRHRAGAGRHSRCRIPGLAASLRIAAER